MGVHLIVDVLDLTVLAEALQSSQGVLVPMVLALKSRQVPEVITTASCRDTLAMATWLLLDVCL